MASRPVDLSPRVAPQVGLININLEELTLKLGVTSSTQDKVREVFEALSERRKKTVAPTIPQLREFATILELVLDANVCNHHSETRILRGLLYERVVDNTTHLVDPSRPRGP